MRENAGKNVNISHILKAVCTYYSVKTTDLKGKSRVKELVVPRQVAMFLMKNMIDTPYMTIGELLGGRDHTTVMHGVGKIESEVRHQKGKTFQDISNVKQIIMTEQK